MAPDMKRPDLSDWTVWNWIGYITLTLGALGVFVTTLFKDVPDFWDRLPAFAVSAVAYGPLPLVLVALVSLVISSRLKTRRRAIELAPKYELNKRGDATTLLPARDMPKIRFRPESDFAALPIYF